MAKGRVGEDVCNADILHRRPWRHLDEEVENVDEGKPKRQEATHQYCCWQPC
jgi:hypothetical protein